MNGRRVPARTVLDDATAAVGAIRDGIAMQTLARRGGTRGRWMRSPKRGWNAHKTGFLRWRDPGGAAGLSPFLGAPIRAGGSPLSVCLVTNNPLVSSLGAAL